MTILSSFHNNENVLSKTISRISKDVDLTGTEVVARKLEEDV